MPIFWTPWLGRLLRISGGAERLKDRPLPIPDCCQAQRFWDLPRSWAAGKFPFAMGKAPSSIGLRLKWKFRGNIAFVMKFWDLPANYPCYQFWPCFPSTMLIHSNCGILAYPNFKNHISPETQQFRVFITHYMILLSIIYVSVCVCIPWYMTR